jgi:KDO2-lipid IV(A) lauroyltransferase
LKETGKVFVEACVLWHRDWAWLQTKIVGVEGEDILRAELAQQKGLLVLAPHFGNWEVVGPYLVSRAPLTVMYKPAAIPQLDKLIYNARTALNMQLAPTNRKGVSMLLKALQSGGMVGILPDQLPEPGAGAEAVPFFGQSAMTMSLAHALITRTGCRVVACVAVRVAQGFKLVTLPVDEAIYSQDVQTSVAAMNRTIERCVLLAPAQYQWEYNRFRLNVPKSQQPAEI